MRNALLPLLLLLSGLLFGQNPYDSTYIQTYPEDLQAVTSVAFHQSNISIKANNTTSLDYEQTATVISTRVQFDKWGMGLSVPTRLLNGKSNSSSFGFQLQLFPKSMMINAGIQRMKGFHKVNLDNSDVEAFYGNRQDVQLLHMYLNPIYVFCRNKYSLRSSLQLTERQLKSHGSFLAALRIEYLRLKSNSDLIEEEQLNNVLSNYVFRQNGIEGGYTYTQVLAKNFFVSGIVLGGFAHTRTGYQHDNSKYHFKKWQLLPISDLTVSLGYQSNRYVSAIQINYRNRPIKSSDIQMEANGLTVQLQFGMRLHAPGLRRAVDQRTKQFTELFVLDR